MYSSYARIFIKEETDKEISDLHFAGYFDVFCAGNCINCSLNGMRLESQKH